MHCIEIEVFEYFFLNSYFECKIFKESFATLPLGLIGVWPWSNFEACFIVELIKEEN